MSGNIIDRRLNPKNKSAVNRGRFLDRYKERIRDSIKDAINGRSVTDSQKGVDVSVPKKDLSEPYFGHDGSGQWDTVRPGNKDFSTGDRVKRPDKSVGKGSTGSDDDETGEDDFTFTLTKEEFMHYFFEGLALPNLIKKRLMELPDYKNKRAGYKTSGPQSTMNVLRSMKGALGRRIALGGKTKKELEWLENIYDENIDNEHDFPDNMDALLVEINHLKSKLSRIPFIDPIDLRYSNTVKVPQPTSVAVMICIMDISGSMGEHEKDIAKRFFILLYLFLTKSYEKIEIVFIQHHTQAKEVDEQEFFNSKENGGTMVSSALKLTDKIIKERYSGEEYNIYIAQASDGDNFYSDTQLCEKILRTNIIPFIQYYAYIEIAEGLPQNLWELYEQLSDEYRNFQIRDVSEIEDVYPVFVDLFKKEEN